MFVLVANDVNPAVLSDELTLINSAYAAVSALDEKAKTLTITDSFGSYHITVAMLSGGFLFIEATADSFAATIANLEAPHEAFASLVKALRPKKHSVHKTGLALT